MKFDCSHICNYHSLERKQNMNTIVKWFAKKYVASIVTDLLEAASKKVDIDVWKARVKNVLDFC